MQAAQQATRNGGCDGGIDAVRTLWKRFVAESRPLLDGQLGCRDGRGPERVLPCFALFCVVSEPIWHEMADNFRDNFRIRTWRAGSRLSHRGASHRAGPAL